MKKQPKILFPQANNLNLIYQILYDIGPDGITKEDVAHKYNMDARQGAYYLDALVYIGVVEKYNVKYFLNEKGTKIRLDSADQAKASFCNCIINHHFLGELYENTQSMDSKDTIDYIASKIFNEYGLNTGTSKRRASSIVSWFNTVNEVVNGKEDE